MTKKKKEKVIDINSLEVKYQLHQEELEKNPAKAKENFIKNLDDNKDLRLRMWEKLYWDMKGKIQYRNNKQLMISQAEKEYLEMNYKQKSKWYDFITNDSNALSVLGELNYIAFLLKEHKGNMKKVWKDLKVYGKKKKEKEQNDK